MIIGYAAVLKPERVGLEITALGRLRYPSGNYRPFRTLLDTTPEIVEADHVTGEDCFVLKVLARSMGHLEEVTGRISGLGAVTTSVVYSSPPGPTGPHRPGGRAQRVKPPPPTRDSLAERRQAAYRCWSVDQATLVPAQNGSCRYLGEMAHQAPP